MNHADIEAQNPDRVGRLRSCWDRIFPRHFEMFDACTAGLFAAAGLGYEKITTDEMIVLPMVDIHSKFMIPSKYGEEVIVETTITEFRRGKFSGSPPHV